MTALQPGPPLDSADRPATDRGLGGHQPGLDGIRGIDMLAMLAFHAELSFGRGAFLALSQFFTLSGFLVTSVLLHGLDRRDGIGLRRFWGRRMRRLWPASLVALAGIGVFGATVATGPQADALPRQVAGAAGHVANWLFVVDKTSYVDQFAAPSPVQHFWSLSLEEQFYLLLPLSLVGLLRFTRSRAVMASVYAGAAVLSTAWMVHLTRSGAGVDRVYYGTDTRMAEILVGVVLAFVVAELPVAALRRSRWSPYLGWAGAVACAVTFWMFVNVRLAEGAMWQGGIVAFSLLTCAVILGVLSGHGPLRVLGWGPFPPLGRIAYGLYLYHLPIFLWLTQDRTGLDQWPLLALRLAVTFAAAIASYHLVEIPIRNGGRLPAGRLRLVAGPALAVSIVALTFVTANRDGGDPQGTLRETASTRTAPPVAADDRAVDVLVFADEGWRPLADLLEQDAAARDDVRITTGGGLGCSGLSTGPAGPTCASWEEDWPALVEEADPDAVLLLADEWEGPDLTDPADGDEQDPTAIARAVMARGIDLLAAEGASVVWAASEPRTGFVGPAPAPPSAFRQARDALLRLEPRLHTTGYLAPRPAVLDQAYLRASASVVLDAVQSHHRRRSAADVPRVMVVGDSQARSVGYGLEQLEASTNGAVVWNLGEGGCSIANDGVVRDLVSDEEAEPDPTCVQAVAAWPAAVAAFHPDIVLVLSSLRDLLDRRLPGDDDFRTVGDASIDTYLVDTYADAVDALGAGGARVVWMVPPCVRFESPLGGGGEAPPAYAPERMARLVDTVLPALVRARPDQVELYALDEVLCPGGTFLDDTDELQDIRPDGIHLSPEASLWLAGILHEDVVERTPG